MGKYQDEQPSNQEAFIKLFEEVISDLKFYGDPKSKVDSENVVLNIMFEDAVERYERELKRLKKMIG